MLVRVIRKRAMISRRVIQKMRKLSWLNFLFVATFLHSERERERERERDRQTEEGRREEGRDK